MKILQILNWHRYGGGSEFVAQHTTELLMHRGHTVRLKILDSRKLAGGLDGKLRAFACGIYSPTGVRIISKQIARFKPDIVHVHEIYPFFSPWIFPECRRSGVPVVLTCHDNRLTCPVLKHWRNGEKCELCSGGRYYWCFIKNCRGNSFESLAYSLRSLSADWFNLYNNYVSQFLVLTEFARKRLINAGFCGDKMMVVPNTIPMQEIPVDPSEGSYAVFAGRLSAEKGLDVLLKAMSLCPDIRLKVAGQGPLYDSFKKAAPVNVSFTGFLKKPELAELYTGARFVIVPSLGLEGFPIIFLEAMSYGLPIITTDIGPLNEIITNSVEGLTVKPADVEDLRDKIRLLWNDPQLCQEMGRNSREKMMEEYSEDIYYEKLMNAYHSAIDQKQS
ncbi:glycosyltransferase family 4 protein [candidate division KSB1 bacterium]|nr:glycosyltransferase family 4 protein [candidate division KSB1 bacterium]